jgi:tetratricopeptide (TPR) repeat protein
MGRYRNKPTPDASSTEAALDAMDADGLRALVREMMPWFDDVLHARFVNALVDRAARTTPSWAPKAPDSAQVGEIQEFAEAAKRIGYAEPSDVDAYLRQGANAFLAKNYAAAFQIFRALLIPAGHGEFHLGQDEMIDEVLGIDPATCAAQYVASMYMTATPQDRGKAVLSAIDEMHGIGHFWEPLRELERVAIEPLPDIDDFLVQWKALVEERVQKDRKNDWDSDEDRWLREVVQRTQGPAGLADVARASKRADDLRAWCRSLVEAGDWKGALAAYDEAAELVSDKEYARGDFLDGAALAAQELRRKDLPARLKRAWREAPSMVRLRRWLGSSKSGKVLLGRVSEALAAVPKNAHRQRALLHVLGGDFTEAAKLLGSAKGLGWSSGDHPGHLLFPLFTSLLGGIELPDEPERDYDELSLLSDRDEARLATPDVADIIRLAGIQAPTEPATRAAVIKSMRTAAEKRIAGVTENKRRRHYGHAASLALACAQVDGSATATKWLEGIRDEYRRYPALQRELGGRKGRA